MRMKLHLAVLSVFLASSYSWVLQSNIDEIIPQKTQHLELACRQDYSDEEKLNIQKINRIRITKLYAFGHKFSLAEISLSKDINKVSVDDSFKVSGSISTNQTAFLKIVWPNVSRDDAGAYGCEIDGFDKRSNFVNLAVAPKIIKERIITMDDIRQLIESMSKKHDEKERELEEENTKLRTFINNELNVIRQENIDKENTFSSKMLTLEQDMKFNYATKKELATDISIARNHTVNEIDADNVLDEMKRRQILEAFRNSSEDWDKKFSKVSHDITTVTIELNESITRFEDNSKNIYKYVNSTLNDVESKVKSVDNKYENATKNLENEFDKKISESKCSCQAPETTTVVVPTKPTTRTTTPTTTTTTTKDVETGGWPGGSYGLVEPSSGCPNPQKLTTRKDDAHNKYIQFIIRYRLKKFDANTCMMEVKSPSKWPKGNYCIVQNNGRCPDGFASGTVRYDISVRLFIHVDSYSQNFCCRSDAPDSSPITLPTDTPFYLIKYTGDCQTVNGMDVTRTYVNMETKKSYVKVKTSHSGAQTSSVLCHYHAKANDDKDQKHLPDPEQNKSKNENQKNDPKRKHNSMESKESGEKHREGMKHEHKKKHNSRESKESGEKHRKGMKHEHKRKHNSRESKESGEKHRRNKKHEHKKKHNSGESGESGGDFVLLE